MIINRFTFKVESTIIQIINYTPIILLIFGIALFIKSYNKIQDHSHKKSLRIILYGFLIGGLGFVYYFFLFLPILMKTGLNPLLRVPTILVLAIPISFGYSIFKYRILDTEFIIKKLIVTLNLIFLLFRVSPEWPRRLFAVFLFFFFEGFPFAFLARIDEFVRLSPDQSA